MSTETTNSFQKVQVPVVLSFLSARVTFALGEKMVQETCIIQIVFKRKKQASIDSSLDSAVLKWKNMCLQGEFINLRSDSASLTSCKKKTQTFFFFLIMQVFARLASWRFCISAKNPPIFQSFRWGKECGVTNLPLLCSSYTVVSSFWPVTIKAAVITGLFFFFSPHRSQKVK